MQSLCPVSSMTAKSARVEHKCPWQGENHHFDFWSVQLWPAGIVRVHNRDQQHVHTCSLITCIDHEKEFLKRKLTQTYELYQNQPKPGRVLFGRASPMTPSRNHVIKLYLLSGWLHSSLRDSALHKLTRSPHQFLFVANHTNLIRNKQRKEHDGYLRIWFNRILAIHW